MESCKPPITEIVKVVCSEYNITEDKLKSKCRSWEIVDAKQTICFIRMVYCKDTSLTLSQEYGFSHPAILHSKKAAISKLDGTTTTTGTYYPYKKFKDKFDKIAEAIGFKVDIDQLKQSMFDKQSRKVLRSSGINPSK
jgi:hypothetical protein